MEDAVLIVEHLSADASAGLPRAELPEILSSARHYILVELHHDGALGCVPNRDVKVDARILNC